jgi:protein-S-isoprenylcysteine O-methyltransferase Ste14
MGSFDSAAQLSGTDPGTLHSTGVYRATRNPQYLGISIALAGVALATRSAYTALLAAGVAATYRRWIPAEERHLARTFGDTYRRYQTSTHRWLGQPRTP